MESKFRVGGVAFLPLAIILGVLGLGSPVYFATVSELSLADIGENTKTVDEEMLRVRDIVLANKLPRRLELQPNLFLDPVTH